jgi:hypothetical protein
MKNPTIAIMTRSFARVFVARETGSVCRDCVVVDAVPQNRSRVAGFPANREKNREFAKNLHLASDFISNCQLRSMAYEKIP